MRQRKERLSVFKMTSAVQHITVFQQNESGRGKIEGIARFGDGRFHLEVVSIDRAFPPIIDDAAPFLPDDLQTDLVLDFLKHPDLSQDLAIICRDRNIPVIASGKKTTVDGVIAPPT